MKTIERTVCAPLETQSNTDRNFAVAVYRTHVEAEGAVKELQHSGFDMTKLSIAGRDYTTEEHVIGYYNTGDRMKAWGKAGAFWGGLWGFMFGALFLIPGVGPILVAGPLVAWIVGALEGSVVVGGLSALGAALFSSGIPKDSVLHYENEIQAGKYVLLAHGTPEDVGRAKSLLDITNHIELTEHLS